MANGKMPYLVALLVNIISAGLMIFSKVALNHGMNSFVFIFYRQVVSSIFLLPMALFFERKKAPPLSYVILLKIFFVSLIGITGCINIYMFALNYTSPTLASATMNSIPVITFVIALAFGMEKLKLESSHGKAKIFGVILCMGGVSIIAFYTGPRFNLKLLHLPHNGSDHHVMQPETHAISLKKTWIEGTFLMFLSNILSSLWMILQGKILVEYPTKLLFNALQCSFSVVTCFCLSIAVERDLAKWRLGFDVALMSILYCGIMMGITLYLQAWCIEKKGPVFLAMTTPSSFVITTIISGVFLNELISLGSILGGVSMVGGLYSVLWGKSIEHASTTLLAESSRANNFSENT